MRSSSRQLLLLLIVVSTMGFTVQAQSKAPKMTKQERVCLRNGNKLYEQKRYAEAEVEYKKALQANPNSEKAQFNLATAYMRQGSVTAQQDDKNNPMNQAEGILTNLAKGAQDKQLRGKAAYDLGNIAYGRQQYDQAVECYKQALRCNPNDEQARHNLRLAQLKKQQQDKNKDKNKDNQDKNQDKDKQNQDQNKDQNKDQQDQNKDQQDQNQNKQNQDNQQNQQQNQQQKQEQGGMSKQNAEQVLKAMQDRERATQQRINAQQAQQQRHERRRTNKKW